MVATEAEPADGSDGEIAIGSRIKTRVAAVVAVVATPAVQLEADEAACYTCSTVGKGGAMYRIGHKGKQTSHCVLCYKGVPVVLADDRNN